ELEMRARRESQASRPRAGSGTGVPPVKRIRIAARPFSMSGTPMQRSIPCQPGFDCHGKHVYTGVPHRRPLAEQAFTLVELLIVIGLIVLFVGGAALALGGRGGEGAALAGAQSLLAGLVGATRAQSALHQT